MKQWIKWVLAIVAAVIPLVLFTSILSLFGAGDGELKGLTSSEAFSPAILKPFPSARLGIVTLEYGWWVFAHVLICMTVAAYFATLLVGHTKRASREVLPRLATVVAIIVGTVGVLAYMVLTPDRTGDTIDAAFAYLVMTPFYNFLTAAGLADQFTGQDGDPWLYLSLGTLGPTSFGILCVTLASANFHHDVQSRRAFGTEGWEQDYAACLRSLKTYAAVLSLILVSSTLTARAYFHIVPKMLAVPAKDAPDPGIYKIYSDFAGEISTASGLMFTMTLIATFAPGLIVLLRDISGAVRESGQEGRQSLMEQLGLTDIRTNLSTILRIGLTVASPALASPIAEVFQSL
ncbi:hypothetical protein EOI86_15295 [Hwanghaeella grinnelliae]|uniref:Uncharacterized protein n=1 Tax=Hwanghaeella grinnelliae TaxID=2500179 RepID=A0A3S3UP41_9PROT|nr:hypothetical protein [Hwanghaeella grinnelliae]RVU36552.1 hypothetical protein EOI86_15295 [Hwanghaeella grinnelliae]